MMRKLFSLVLLLTAATALAATGKWTSAATGASLTYTTSAPTGTAAKDASGKPMTIVYLENLAIPKIGQNSNADDIAWLRSQGYQVIELDYAKNAKAVSPTINADIIAINKSLQNGSFCGCTCSNSRSYILMEGYRICRDISYYRDDPTVYNHPDVYKDSQGDSLFLDLVYPANPSVNLPVLVTFSYSNSYATNSSGKLTDANKHKRMYLPYFWGQFNDSFVEGASAIGFAWAVCDHPKYCDWGQGKYKGGANKSLGAIEVNPDAARKVKSAIRTVRALGRDLGLNGDVAVTGFSRGSTAAALAVGDDWLDDYEDASRGRFSEESSLVQCAVLGPGMFDYEHALSSSNEFTRMKAFVNANPSCPWSMQGALATIKSSASAPTLFFHNTDDYYSGSTSAGLYATQATLMKEKLDNVGATTAVLKGYSSGHNVPQKPEDLQHLYDFLLSHIIVSTPTGIRQHTVDSHHATDDATYTLMGTRTNAAYRGLVIRNGKIYINK